MIFLLLFWGFLLLRSIAELGCFCVLLPLLSRGRWRTRGALSVTGAACKIGTDTPPPGLASLLLFCIGVFCCCEPLTDKDTHQFLPGIHTWCTASLRRVRFRSGAALVFRPPRQNRVHSVTVGFPRSTCGCRGARAPRWPPPPSSPAAAASRAGSRSRCCPSPGAYR